jgi:hypothetical protein
MLGASRAALIGVERIPDPFYASTSLIAQFEGSDAATSSTDQSPVGNTLTFAGNAELDTAQIGLGVSSLLLPGSSGDYVGLPSHVSLELGGDFTIEFMMRIGATNGVPLRLQHNAPGYTAQAFYVDPGGDLGFYSSSTGGSFDIASAVTISSGLSTGVWYWVAVTRNGNDYATYLDGTRTQTFTNSSTPISGLSSAIGADANGTSNFNGHIDQVRITKGVARYTGASYVVPTDLYPTA